MVVVVCGRFCKRAVSMATPEAVNVSKLLAFGSGKETPYGGDGGRGTGRSEAAAISSERDGCQLRKRKDRYRKPTNDT